MPTINATVQAGGTTYGRAKQITTTDLQNRVIPALRAIYGQVPVEPVDPQNPIPQMRDRTDPEVMEEWSRRTMQQLNHDVKEYERRKAAQTAIDGVADVPLTD